MKLNSPSILTLYIAFQAITLIHSSDAFAQTTWYRQSGGVQSQINKTYISVINDTSGVYITNSGSYTLANSKISTSGNTSNVDSSGRSGQNAGILINSHSSTTLNYDTIVTSGSGANGIFSCGSGAAITISNSVVNTSGAHARGINATYGGTVTLTNVYIATTNDTSSAIATDCAGGTINFVAGIAMASGALSAGVYSTGDVTVSNSVITSNGDHAAVTDVDGKITVNNSTLNGAMSGLMVHKTVTGNYTSTAVFTGTVIHANAGHVIYDTAANLDVTFNGNDTVNASSGNLVYACSVSTVNVTLNNEQMTGNVYADASSTINASLANTTVLNATVTNAAMTLDEGSKWNVTGNSYLTSLTDAGGVNLTSLAVSNIIGNGFNVYYKSSLSGNSWLAGKTYALSNGGCLLPEGAVCSTAEVQNVADPYQVNIYPNPVQRELEISFLSPVKNIAYRILQPDGRVVGNGFLNGPAESVSVEKLVPGLYFLSISFNDKMQVTRFIKD